ncbi:hypothetical protein LTR56_027552 [Elasticomyces elasticus]|nr:hypothetical protein LTR56_027552 [Elasticomyces elasticus]KAK3620573.1 hypothetical protein LTR22_025549 [Elasticomyces elasticus]KAK4904116.1 hypothetical protein LTR49_026370 [Elasticomyces elasticus]KAK5740163.1 hypothetical protein LTS12_025040 [Elasticomyces elasticus]
MPNRQALRLVIVGGVSGGMAAATRARRLCETASITVLEAGPYVSYAASGIPYALSGVIAGPDEVLMHPTSLLKARFNIDVYINSEVVDIDRTAKMVTVQRKGVEGSEFYSYDKLILALGASASMLVVPGVDLPRVFSLRTIDDMIAIREHIASHDADTVAVIGGGFIGLEATTNLTLMGLKVTLLEAASHVYALADAEMVGPVHAELRRCGVNLLLDESVVAIVEGAGDGAGIRPLSVTTACGNKFAADLVIMAVGVQPRTALAFAAGLKIGKLGVSFNEHLQTSDPDIYAVGDMTESEHLVTDRPTSGALAGPASRQGRMAADNVWGRNVVWRGNVGTSICQVFSMTIASTGLSVHTAEALGFNVEWVTIHPPNHVTYYPESWPMTLRVVFDRDIGLILGAQVTGLEGVDKRIDVLATCIQAAMTMHDLEHLELSYAPQYSSAKGPINMAGFVGGNVVDGNVRILHPEDLANLTDDWELVDVRSDEDFFEGHLRGAINVPLERLRGSAKALIDQAKRILLYSEVGYRGYLAYRILDQTGRDVYNLDGGYKSVVQSRVHLPHDMATRRIRGCKKESGVP